MTSGLAQRRIAKRWLAFSIRCLVGLLVLVPAFLVWMQFAFLNNVARSKGLEGNWESLLVPIATVGYLFVFGIWVFTRKSSVVRDGYLILYCGYIAGILAYMFSGNFLQQFGLYGAGTALTNHLEDFIYLAFPVAFLLDRLIMVFARQYEQSNF